MDHCDVAVPKKIGPVQGEQVLDAAVNPHGSDQARIVDLCSGNFVGDYPPPPFRVNPFVVGCESLDLTLHTAVSDELTTVRCASPAHFR